MSANIFACTNQEPASYRMYKTCLTIHVPQANLSSDAPKSIMKRSVNRTKFQRDDFETNNRFELGDYDANLIQGLLARGNAGKTVKTGSSSEELKYTPRYSKDFGTFECFAQNPVGSQTEPCIIKVQRASE